MSCPGCGACGGSTANANLFAKLRDPNQETNPAQQANAAGQGFPGFQLSGPQGGIVG